MRPIRGAAGGAKLIDDIHILVRAGRSVTREFSAGGFCPIRGARIGNPQLGARRTHPPQPLSPASTPRRRKQASAGRGTNVRRERTRVKPPPTLQTRRNSVESSPSPCREGAGGWVHATQGGRPSPTFPRHRNFAGRGRGRELGVGPSPITLLSPSHIGWSHALVRRSVDCRPRVSRPVARPAHGVFDPRSAHPHVPAVHRGVVILFLTASKGKERVVGVVGAEYLPRTQPDLSAVVGGASCETAHQLMRLSAAARRPGAVRRFPLRGRCGRLHVPLVVRPLEPADEDGAARCWPRKPGGRDRRGGSGRGGETGARRALGASHP